VNALRRADKDEAPETYTGAFKQPTDAASGEEWTRARYSSRTNRIRKAPDFEQSDSLVGGAAEGLE